MGFRICVSLFGRLKPRKQPERYVQVFLKNKKKDFIKNHSFLVRFSRIRNTGEITYIIRNKKKIRKDASGLLEAARGA
jgi:hypothetical protein